MLSKAQNTAAEKLKDGDVTHEKLRNVIRGDLDSIKEKIDGLSRKDLLASYSFLKEGILTLYLALDEAKDEQINIDEEIGAQNGGSQTSALTTSKESEISVLNEAITLLTALQKQNNANGRLFAAKELFKAAREEATRAFWNEALSLLDRIMATKLRVASKILECFQDTRSAAAGCMLFLEELHNLAAVGQAFSTYFKGGIKSIFYKDSRLENVKSVLLLNFAISRFITTFSVELPNVKSWPRIHLLTKGETMHPLLLDIDVLKNVFGKMQFQLPEKQDILPTMTCSLFSCINSKGQLLYYRNHHVYVLNRSGGLKMFCEFRQATAQLGAMNRRVRAIAVDRHDNVYVFVSFADWKFDTESDNKLDVWYAYAMFIFDSNGNEKCKHVLDIHFPVCPKYFKCVVKNDGDILIQFWPNNFLYICDGNGDGESVLFLKENSSNPNSCLRGDMNLQCVTDQNDIVVHKLKNVLVFTEDGMLKRQIQIDIDDMGRCLGVTYNFTTSRLEILTQNLSFFPETTFYSIRSCSEDDKVECLRLPLTEGIWCLAWFSSHPAGPSVFAYLRHNHGMGIRIVFM